MCKMPYSDSTLKQHSVKQQGVLLVEAMVALAVFSIAILGLSALQLTSSKNALSSLLRTETSVVTSEIIDMMRANLPDVALGRYDLNFGDGVFGSPANQAEVDINEWLDNLVAMSGIGVAPDASITCGNPTRPNPLDCTIMVQWNDSRAAQDATSSQLFMYTTNVNL